MLLVLINVRLRSIKYLPACLCFAADSRILHEDIKPFHYVLLPRKRVKSNHFFIVFTSTSVLSLDIIQNLLKSITFLWYGLESGRAEQGGFGGSQ